MGKNTDKAQEKDTWPGDSPSALHQAKFCKQDNPEGILGKNFGELGKSIGIRYWVPLSRFGAEVAGIASHLLKLVEDSLCIAPVIPITCHLNPSARCIPVKKDVDTTNGVKGQFIAPNYIQSTGPTDSGE